jgi:tetraacyldisaccharide 4'-kinase
VSAFSLVGGGTEYRDRGIEVISPVSDLPSAGIIKYSLKALLGDFKYGLRKMIKKQIGVWRKQRGKFRAPICVGDVYLLAHTLWGQGLSPLLVATAKSVKLRDHWMAERSIMKRRALKVWTRDAETAADLNRRGVNAVFRGNPIMDLALESDSDDDPWEGLPRPRVMLLPGSRPRAYKDARLLLDAVKIISENMRCGFIMVLAPTLDFDVMLSEVKCSVNRRGRLDAGASEVAVYTGPIASVAYGADLLLGLGGTANQVSAGLGVPVLSVIERGKLVQKKLLQDAEVLTRPTAFTLAHTALEILKDPVRRFRMSKAGIEMLGGAGALDAVVEFAADELGWDARCKLSDTLLEMWSAAGETADFPARYSGPWKEKERIWKMPKGMANKLLKVVKIIK